MIYELGEAYIILRTRPYIQAIRPLMDKHEEFSILLFWATFEANGHTNVQKKEESERLRGSDGQCNL